MDAGYVFPYPVLPEGWQPYDDDKDYCGPEGSSLSIFICRKIDGVDTNKCCWAHDQRYEIGGTEVDKMEADMCFYRDMKIAIKAKYKWYNPIRWRALIRAKIRFDAVSELGDRFFNYH